MRFVGGCSLASPRVIDSISSGMSAGLISPDLGGVDLDWNVVD
jgi:hypothetical protein